MPRKAVPSSTKCVTCHHPRSFHPGGGRCLAAQCSAECKKFKMPSPAAATTMPVAPDPSELIAALDVLTTVVQRAPKTYRAKAAINLEWFINSFPTLRRAAGSSDRPLRQILADCRQPPAAPQDAEVAPDDARDTPGPD